MRWQGGALLMLWWSRLLVVRVQSGGLRPADAALLASLLMRLCPVATAMCDAGITCYGSPHAPLPAF